MSEFPKPSELMRHRKPYLFSDSGSRIAYRLSRSELSHMLDTITERNQTRGFEIFCTKLCEREICSNLRPQTGPEGGGDAKADTETYPVSEEISERWYVGTANPGSEPWAFAISAMQKWSEKVRSDVAGIVEHAAGHKRIFYLTSRPTRSKDRSRIEKELTENHKIPVTILDRQWIIERVFKNEHFDIAYQHLGAGAFDPNQVSIGPNDFRRRKELDELEKGLAASNADRPLPDAAADALDAAYLSRELELPRHETAGRFERAISLAKKYGLNGQELRARYERVWTYFWWFDDIDPLNEQYEEIEKLAFDTNLSLYVEKISNLHQLLVGRIVQGLQTAEELNFEARSKRLKDKLQSLSENRSLPNNALHAEALLQLQKLNELGKDRRDARYDEVWASFIDIIDRAAGMGEFPASMLDSVIDALSGFVPESTTFDRLIEKLADFMSARARDGKAGEIHKRRGEQKLDAEKPIEAIRWLGKASINFAKEEFREEQFETLYMLTVAYRGAGLLWAARATALAALVQISALSADRGAPRPEFLPTASLLALISVQLGHLPEFLSSVQLFKVLSSAVAVADDARADIEEKNLNLDKYLACLLIKANMTDLGHLENLPDVLEALGLFFSRSTLVYRLGQKDTLQTEGYIPEGEDPNDLVGMMEQLAVQPAVAQLPSEIILNEPEFQNYRTEILGVKIGFLAPSIFSCECEAHIAALESFAATTIGMGAFPHAEELCVEFLVSDDVSDAENSFDPKTMKITVRWPSSWDFSDPGLVSKAGLQLLKFCADVMDAVLVFENPAEALELIAGDERAFERSTLFSNAGVSRSRVFGKRFAQLADWEYLVKKRYPLTDGAPVLVPHANAERQATSEDSVGGDLSNMPQRHGDYSVSSLINVHLWARAGWKGFAYGTGEPGSPPFLGLMFENIEYGEAIFDAWLKALGPKDEKNDLRVSAIKGVDRNNPFYYRAFITRSADGGKDGGLQTKVISQPVRMQTMYVQNHENLNRFLKAFHDTGCYWILPATVPNSGAPQFSRDHAILKNAFNVRDAWQIGLHDEDLRGLLSTDDVYVPGDVGDPPYAEVLLWRKELQDAKRDPAAKR